MPSLSSAFDFISLVREMSLDNIREQARIAPLIALVGSDEARFAMLRTLGRGSVASGIVQTSGFQIDESEAAYLESADIVIAVFTDREAPNNKSIGTLRRLVRVAKPLLVIREAGNGGSTGPDSFALPGATIWVSAIDEDSFRTTIAPRILDALPDHQIGLARRLAAFRPGVSQRLIRDVSIGNAKFAAASNVPALVPVLGTIIAAAGDFLVLTKNQMLLLFKLAAVHGRDLTSSTDLYLELAPVVGNALVWRTVARELVGLVPPMLGAVPKVAIAYAGTFAVGQAATYYYAAGHRPSKQLLDQFYRDAANSMQRSHLLDRVRSSGATLPVLGGVVNRLRSHGEKPKRLPGRTVRR